MLALSFAFIKDSVDPAATTEDHSILCGVSTASSAVTDECTTGLPAYLVSQATTTESFTVVEVVTVLIYWDKTRVNLLGFDQFGAVDAFLHGIGFYVVSHHQRPFFLTCFLR